MRTRSSPSVLGDGRDAQVEGVAVGELDDGRADGCRRDRTGRSRTWSASVVVVGGVHGCSSVWVAADRTATRSSGMGIGVRALTSAPPVLPTG